MNGYIFLAIIAAIVLPPVIHLTGVFRGRL